MNRLLNEKNAQTKPAPDQTRFTPWEQKQLLNPNKKKSRNSRNTKAVKQFKLNLQSSAFLSFKNVIKGGGQELVV